MKCTVSLFTILAISTFILPTKIGCSCSNNLNDIIGLILQDPDFQRNPCYIEWKAGQDKKFSELWQQIGELENSADREHEIELRNRQIEREKLMKSFRKTTVTALGKKGSLSAGAIFAIVIFGLCGLCCSCIAACNSIESDDSPTANPTTNNIQFNQITVISNITTAFEDQRTINLSSATSGFGDQRTINLSSATNASTNLSAYSVPRSSSPIRISIPSEQETNVPLLPRVTINRQSSLPSYEDAVKMPSVPSIE